MFELGREYRRRDIHRQYGGQQQGGISTPTGTPAIFLITGESGAAHGYDDGWEGDVFLYFGEGQVGDMQLVRGNRAVRDHSIEGRELHLFEDLGNTFLRYRGEVVCGGYEVRPDVPDTLGNLRKAIVFRLVPADGLKAPTDLEQLDSELPQDLAALRELAMASATEEPDTHEAKRKVWRRSAALRKYVLRRADGTCEGCGEPAPFITAAGRPYLEPHHTRHLSDGGPDDPRWVIATCPTCHRRAHYANDAHDFNAELKVKLKSLEPA
jgi:5-methylcytosine-specific restriction protein A